MIRDSSCGTTDPIRALRIVLCGILISACLVVVGASETVIRFATFNVSLYRSAAGQLVEDLETGVDAQAQVIAEIIQRVRPDVLLINEFDYDVEGRGVQAFRDLYLAFGQDGASPILDYDYMFVGPSNTGVPSGHDLNNNGRLNEAADALGYGEFEGQYGMVVFSRYPIVESQIRTFRNFLWADLPGALLPEDWYSDEELRLLPLSSKSHWDIPIEVDGAIIHVLACHPTPPVFDGPEDANGRRNHDEIRFWADYVNPDLGGNFYDDAGQTGGLDEGTHFVIMGDMNADPFDGDSTQQPILQLLDSRWINSEQMPESEGAVEQSEAQGRANSSHRGNPAYDTADFSESTGNLRVDYVLPSISLTVNQAGVFWPLSTDPLFSLVGESPFPGIRPSIGVGGYQSPVGFAVN